jgi:hypothetical protein
MLTSRSNLLIIESNLLLLFPAVVEELEPALLELERLELQEICSPEIK